MFFDKKFWREILDKLDQKDGEKPDYPKCGWTEEKPFCHHTNSKPSKKSGRKTFEQKIKEREKKLNEKEPTELVSSARQTERLCMGCSDAFEGGVHAYMCGTCAHILLNEEGIIVPKAALEWLFDKIAPLDRNGIHYVKYHQLKEKYLSKKEDEKK